MRPERRSALASGHSFRVNPLWEGSCEPYKERLRVNVCDKNEEQYRYLWG
jgi:hypothetical protein